MSHDEHMWQLVNNVDEFQKTDLVPDVTVYLLFGGEEQIGKDNKEKYYDFDLSYSHNIAFVFSKSQHRNAAIR